MIPQNKNLANSSPHSLKRWNQHNEKYVTRRPEILVSVLGGLVDFELLILL